MSDWRIQSIARVQRVAGLLLVVCLLAFGATWARAAETCTSPSWSFSWGPSHNVVDPFCTNLQAVMTANGYAALIDACAVDISGGIATATIGGHYADDGALNTRAWSATNSTCTAGAVDPGASAPSGSSITATLVLPAWLDLSAADGLAIATLIISCWSAAFAIKALVRALNVADGNDSD